MCIKIVKNIVVFICVFSFLACSEGNDSEPLQDNSGLSENDTNSATAVVDTGNNGNSATTTQENSTGAIDSNGFNEKNGADASTDTQPTGTPPTDTPPTDTNTEASTPAQPELDSTIDTLIDAGQEVVDAAVVDAADGSDSTETSLVSNCPAQSFEKGLIPRTINIDGVERSYLLYIPESYTGDTPEPLLFDWHGLGMQAEWEYSGIMGLGWSPSEYVPKADAEGFVMVFPQGIDNAWNIGPCCTESRDVDDLIFARELAKAVTNELCIDTKRIYSVGYSNGGGMSLFLACNAADLFAAVGPSAFDLLEEDEEPCHPSRPITVISFRGTADSIVLYEAHESTPPTSILGYSLPNIHIMGAERTFQKFAELDGCIGEPVADIAGAGCRTYTQCNEGVEVTLCAKQGGGHEQGDADIGWPMLKKHKLP